MIKLTALVTLFHMVDSLKNEQQKFQLFNTIWI